MKELSELKFPDDVRYAESHEWAKAQGDTVKVGITDYAQDQLGDIGFIGIWFSPERKRPSRSRS